jgi:hypothetical protein
MTPEQDELIRELIANPPPGSKLEEAKRFGIDLTLLYENLKLTPEQRLRTLAEDAAFSEMLGSARRLPKEKP